MGRGDPRVDQGATLFAVAPTGEMRVICIGAVDGPTRYFPASKFPALIAIGFAVG